MRKNPSMKTHLTVVHQDGGKDDEILASVLVNKIYTEDVTVRISIGDKIKRNLPSGEEQTFIATNIHLWEGAPESPPFYEVEIKREGVQQLQPKPPVVHINNSPQAHVNVGSTDQSINQQSSATVLVTLCHDVCPQAVPNPLSTLIIEALVNVEIQ